MKPSCENISGYIHGWIQGNLSTGEFKSFEELLEFGLCADLATVLWEHFRCDKKIILHSCAEPCHTWVEFDGRHYDMQNPNGIKRWRKMKYFLNHPQAKLDSECTGGNWRSKD